MGQLTTWSMNMVFAGIGAGGAAATPEPEGFLLAGVPGLLGAGALLRRRVRQRRSLVVEEMLLLLLLLLRRRRRQAQLDKHRRGARQRCASAEECARIPVAAAASGARVWRGGCCRGPVSARARQ